MSANRVIRVNALAGMFFEVVGSRPKVARGVPESDPEPREPE